MTARPPAGAPVMATGIVAVGLRLDGRGVLSSALLGLAVAIWVVLVAVLVLRFADDPRRVAREARGPGALTLPAATAVLSGALALWGSDVPALCIWVLAAGLWAWLLVRVAARPRRGPGGLWFLPTVATEALAALTALLAVRQEAPWMAALALALVALGLALYPLGLARFPLSELRVGGGEVWIAGGALAAGALACGELVRAIDDLGALGDARRAVEGLDLASWIAAMLWLVALVAAEVGWRRREGRAGGWAAVFPVGMYAAASFVTGAALGPVRDFARAWVWVALAVWALTALAALRRVARGARRDRRAPRGPPPRGSG
jgi:tellurite resistance protein TehA-like permease